MPTVDILIDVRQERIEDVEQSVVAAVVAQHKERVLIVSQYERPELAELADSFGLDYRVGAAVLADFKRAPTLVVHPGQIVDDAFLTTQSKQGLPQGIFFLPATWLTGNPKTDGALGSLGRLFANLGGAKKRDDFGKTHSPEHAHSGSKRSFERHHVSMKATVNGQLARCIDIHQRGGGFLVAKSNLAIDDRVPVAVECRNVLGGTETATGILQVRSLRTATDAGETWRISGIVEWSSPRDLALVLEHAYIVERFEKPDSTRSASRAPVSIPATVQGNSAECIDLSLGGAAFAVEHFAVEPAERLKVELHLANGQTVVGHLLVRGVSQGRRITRVSGTMTWDDDTWLIRHTRLQFRPNR